MPYRITYYGGAMEPLDAIETFVRVVKSLPKEMLNKARELLAENSGGDDQLAALDPALAVTTMFIGLVTFGAMNDLQEKEVQAANMFFKELVGSAFELEYTESDGEFP